MDNDIKNNAGNHTPKETRVRVKIFILVLGLVVNFAVAIPVFFLLIISSTGTVGYVSSVWNAAYIAAAIALILYIAGSVGLFFNNEKKNIFVSMVFFTPVAVILYFVIAIAIRIISEGV